MVLMGHLLDQQGYGHDSECSSQRRVVISGLGWRAQCCERSEGEKEREDMAAPEGEREARKRRERRDSGCAHERKERRPHSEERPPPPPPPPPLHDYNRLESERRAERLSRARRPQHVAKRRRATARLPRQPKENDCAHTDDTRSGTPPHFEYVVQQKPEICEETERSSVEASARQEEAERERRGERNEPPRRTMPSPDRRLEKINKKWVDGCRQASGRASIPEANWTPAQLAAEKSCVQRALLRLEAARGRPPAHSAERGAARHLYERYRAVKRALATYRSDVVIGGPNGELATIHEHEAMLFNTSVDSSSDSQEKPSDSSQETIETPLQSPPTREGLEEMPSSTSSAKSATTSEEVEPSNESLHCLGLDDLTRALSEAKLLKCVLRRSIKEYEVNFELQNSRKAQRDDKMGREDEYKRYKTVKARIKLINALINKQKSKA
ncbi:protein FAM13A-like isoform X2 [Pararge aegeria]|uniref:protein FAM13A-like isoform X2 n=1 Tax=Pararge aegeria TaxID=116150 RepID=UPI0019D22004|nr:protein FAM13A-like isoform X2 [Pararge aegeria]